VLRPDVPRRWDSTRSTFTPDTDISSREVRSKVGDDFPIIFRMSGDERVPDGRNQEESVAIAPSLVAAGADCLSISTGMGFELTHTVAGLGMPKGLNVATAAAIKSAVEVPVMVAGKLNDPLFAAAVVARGSVDMVAIGRGLVADPEWPNKLREGRSETIRPCVACNQGCIGTLSAGLPFTCLVNPEAGRELDLPIEPATRPKRVWIAGGGPAGMEAARTAALRGHQVTLFEGEQQLGGQLRLASIPPRKQELVPYLRYLHGQLVRLKVEIHLGEALTSAAVQKGGPDAVVVACGGTPVTADLPGFSSEHVCLAVDVLDGRALTGQRVAVVGGGQVGCETAEHLDKIGRDVILLEMQSELAVGELPLPRKILLRALEATRVRVFTNTRLLEVEQESLLVEREGEHEKLDDVDSVVLALGVESRSDLARELEGKVPELHVIGDAKQPGNAVSAIAAGAEVGRRI